MTANTTCVGFENGTSSCPPSSGSSGGLAAGLTIFFLLLMIVPGVLVYKYHREIMARLPFGHRRKQTEDCTEAPEAVSHEYTSLSRDQSTVQTPIYENLTTTRQKKNTVNQSRSYGETEEDLYLQCDLPDDAIYSNDPACNLSILPDSQEEDVYIVPDSV